MRNRTDLSLIPLKCGHEVEWYGHHSYGRKVWCEQCGNYQHKKPKIKEEVLPQEPMF